MLGVFRFNFDAIIMSVAGRKADANLMRAWTISAARNISYETATDYLND